MSPKEARKAIAYEENLIAKADAILSGQVEEYKGTKSFWYHARKQAKVNLTVWHEELANSNREEAGILASHQ